MSFDLKQFCYTGDDRPNLKQPISIGDFTYATNGHIAIRVPRIPDCPESEFDVAKVFPSNPPALMPANIRRDLPAMPEEVKVECDICGGVGTEHACPDCNCDCPHCDGTGEVNTTAKVVMALRGAHFNLKYVAMLAQLPSLALPVKAPKEAGMYFTFEGGDGVLMPMRWADKAIPAELP